MRVFANNSVPTTTTALIHDLPTPVYSTAVGYTAGTTANPTYREVCSGRTGHNEVPLLTELRSPVLNQKMEAPCIHRPAHHPIHL